MGLMSVTSSCREQKRRHIKIQNRFVERYHIKHHKYLSIVAAHEPNHEVLLSHRINSPRRH